MNPTTREPLPVEMLASDDQRRLQAALDAPKPITVDDHQRFRESLAQPPPSDEIDEALADPRLDRLPAYRTGSDAARLEALLDSLERGDG
jgi:hypothetical protein